MHFHLTLHTLDIVRTLTIITCLVSAINFLIIAFAPSSFEHVVRFTMALPTAFCTGINGIALFSLASVLKLQIKQCLKDKE